MQGVRIVDGSRIPDESSDDSTWEDGKEAAAMENPGRRFKATYFTNEFPGEGRPVELPGGGMPGPSGNEDGNVGVLPATACP